MSTQIFKPANIINQQLALAIANPKNIAFSDDSFIVKDGIDFTPVNIFNSLKAVDLLLLKSILMNLGFSNAAATSAVNGIPFVSIIPLP